MRESKSLLPYYGGKAGDIGRITAGLLEKIPHTTYLELFGGMASVLIYKDPVKQEVYNDANGDIVNLFKVLRVKAKRKQLTEGLRYTPYSREHFLECCGQYQNPELDDVERARMLFVVLGQGMLGRLYRKSWGFGGPLYGTSPAKSFYKKLLRFDAVAERLRNVSLECQDARTLIPRWSNPAVLIYLDPPYHSTTRSKGGDYVVELRDEDHVELLDLCLASSAKIVLAGYPNALYERKLEAVGWARQDFIATAESAKKSGTTTERIECLWFSPNCVYVPTKVEKLTKQLLSAVTQGSIF